MNVPFFWVKKGIQNIQCQNWGGILKDEKRRKIEKVRGYFARKGVVVTGGKMWGVGRGGQGGGHKTWWRLEVKGMSSYLKILFKFSKWLSFSRMFKDTTDNLLSYNSKYPTLDLCPWISLNLQATPSLPSGPSFPLTPPPYPTQTPFKSVHQNLLFYEIRKFFKRFEKTCQRFEILKPGKRD